MIRNESEVKVQAGSAEIAGFLTIPPNVRGIVLFAHGSGSSRHSRRNQYVANVLHEAGMATLLIDLLTPAEETQDDITGELRFDIDFLADRLLGANEWLMQHPSTASLPLGYFGASTGGGAALVAAARRPNVAAVVSRGGRPDMVEHFLRNVKAPTLLIVGGNDLPVIALNKRAYDQLRCEKRMEVMPGASHLFEEPGKLQQVAKLASDWFRVHMQSRFERTA
jgi:putative phosphoribosyl transferase